MSDKITCHGFHILAGICALLYCVEYCVYCIWYSNCNMELLVVYFLHVPLYDCIMLMYTNAYITSNFENGFCKLAKT